MNLGFLMGNLETGLGLPLPQTVEKLSHDLLASASYLSVRHNYVTN